jgi:hypothetical protein
MAGEPDAWQEYEPCLWSQVLSCNKGSDGGVTKVQRGDYDHETKENAGRLGKELLMHEPAFNVVVYRNPGPDDNAIEAHAKSVVVARSPWGTGGDLSYITSSANRFTSCRQCRPTLSLFLTMAPIATGDDASDCMTRPVGKGMIPSGNI